MFHIRLGFVFVPKWCLPIIRAFFCSPFDDYALWVIWVRDFSVNSVVKKIFHAHTFCLIYTALWIRLASFVGVHIFRSLGPGYGIWDIMEFVSHIWNVGDMCHWTSGCNCPRNVNEVHSGAYYKYLKINTIHMLHCTNFSSFSCCR